MRTTQSSNDSVPPALPLVASLCGTFLKPEMQSVYRQITGLQTFRTVVLTEQRLHEDLFPFDPLVVMDKLTRPRPKGNFILRFWYKHVVKQWPPPQPITREVAPHYPYNLPALLGRWQPALVHVYYGHKAVKYLPMLQAWGGPWLVSFHGVDVVKFLDDPDYLKQMQAVFASAELVLARSQSLAERLLVLGCPPEKVRLNPTPIPLDGYPEHPRVTPQDGAFRLVQASRLIAKKGLFTTLKAMRRVVQEFPNAKFILCGDGPDRVRFASAVADAGLTHAIECRGWLDQDALKSEFAAAHVFLHPSELTETEDQEGVPNSMLEAMATGLPVVATLHGGIPEAVQHGIDGCLVPEKSPEALAEAILSLLRDNAKRAAMGHAAAQSVRRKFGLAAGIKTLEEAYAESLQRWSARQTTPAKLPSDTTK